MRWKVVPSAVPRRRLLLIAVVVVVLLGGGGWLVYGSSALRVNTVDVRGVGFTDPEVIRAAAAIPSGTSLAAVDADEIAERVAAVPSVRSVEVSRDWPHTIVIEVVERTARLAVPVDDDYLLVDGNGVAYRTVADPPAGAVTAILTDPGPSDPATAAVLTVLSSLTTGLEQRVVGVEAKIATRITVRLKDSRTVFWGDAADSDRKAEVATVLLDRPEPHIDVSAPDVPTVS